MTLPIRGLQFEANYCSIEIQSGVMPFSARRAFEANYCSIEMEDGKYIGTIVGSEFEANYCSIEIGPAALRWSDE